MQTALEIYEELKGANLTDMQARVMIAGMQALVEDRVSELATKHDLHELELATRRDLRELELATKHDLRELELATRRDLRELETKLDSRFLTLEVKIESGRVDTLKWMATLLMGGITTVLGGMYFMFAVFLKH